VDVTDACGVRENYGRATRFKTSSIFSRRSGLRLRPGRRSGRDDGRWRCGLRVRERLAGAGVPPTARLIVVHVSSNSPFRRWPPESFAAAIAELAAPADRRIVVTAGPSEADAVDRIVAAARARLNGAAAERVLRCGEFSPPSFARWSMAQRCHRRR
jgi:hypothetical protein